MTKHLQRDMDSLNRDILSLSTHVEEMIDKASLALLDRRYDLADEVINTDNLVDVREVRIEEECLKLLALHQPVAVDLRRIATVLKVNNDVERIADLAVSIAQRALAMAEFPDFPIPERISRMVTLATRMVRDAFDAFVHLDARAAAEVMRCDDDVDRLNVEVIDELLAMMQQNGTNVSPGLHCFSASRHIERIADHATNIAEDVIYLVQGDIVRHKHLKAV